MTSTPLQHLIFHPENPTESSASDSSSSSPVCLKQEEDVTQAPGVTKVIQKSMFNRRKYRNITDAMRKKLIEAVETQGEKIKHAAKKFNINYSSAKSICQVFKREGRANKKAFKTRINHFKEDAKPRMNLNAKGSKTLLSSVKLSPNHTTKDTSLLTKASPVMTSTDSDQECLLKTENSNPFFKRFEENMNQERLNRINNLLAQYSGSQIKQMMMPSVVIGGGPSHHQIFNNAGQQSLNNGLNLNNSNLIFANGVAQNNQLPQGFNIASAPQNLINNGGILSLPQNVLGSLNNISMDNSKYRMIPISTLPQANNVNMNLNNLNMCVNPVIFGVQQQQQQQQPVKYAIIQTTQPMQQMIGVYPQMNQINTNLYQNPMNYF